MCVHHFRCAGIRSEGAALIHAPDITALIHAPDITLLRRAGGPGPGRGLLLEPAVHSAVDRRALRVPQHHDKPGARLLHALRHSRRHLRRHAVALGPATMVFPLQALRSKGCLALSQHRGSQNDVRDRRQRACRLAEGQHLSSMTSGAAAPKTSGRGRSQSVHAITMACGCFAGAAPRERGERGSRLFLRLRPCSRAQSEQCCHHPWRLSSHRC